jgi:hypothetical protein
MGPEQLPIISTIIVFVVVLVGVAAVGYRFVQSSSKRSSVLPGAPSISVGTMAPPPPSIQPGPVESGMYCPRCGVRSGSDYCTGCGFDLRTFKQPSVVSAVPLAGAQSAFGTAAQRTSGRNEETPTERPLAEDCRCSQRTICSQTGDGRRLLLRRVHRGVCRPRARRSVANSRIRREGARGRHRFRRPRVRDSAHVAHRGRRRLGVIYIRTDRDVGQIHGFSRALDTDDGRVASLLHQRRSRHFRVSALPGPVRHLALSDSHRPIHTASSHRPIHTAVFRRGRRDLRGGRGATRTTVLQRSAAAASS